MRQQSACFDVDGLEVMIHEAQDPGDDPLPEAPVAYTVPAVDATVDRLHDQVLSVSLEPADYPWGWPATFATRTAGSSNCRRRTDALSRGRWRGRGQALGTNVVSTGPHALPSR
jgi:hypothetical protein